MDVRMEQLPDGVGPVALVHRPDEESVLLISPALGVLPVAVVVAVLANVLLKAHWPGQCNERHARPTSQGQKGRIRTLPVSDGIPQRRESLESDDR